MKNCTRCKSELPYSAFGRIGILKSGLPKYNSWCSKCTNAYKRMKYKETKTKRVMNTSAQSLLENATKGCWELTLIIDFTIDNESENFKTYKFQLYGQHAKDAGYWLIANSMNTTQAIQFIEYISTLPRIREGNPTKFELVYKSTSYNGLTKSSYSSSYESNGISKNIQSYQNRADASYESYENPVLPKVPNGASYENQDASYESYENQVLRKYDKCESYEIPHMLMNKVTRIYITDNIILSDPSVSRFGDILRFML